MNIIKGLFFDLDGTLVDTLEANFKAYEKSLDIIGRQLTYDAFKPTFGQRLDVFLPKLFPDITKKEIEDVKKHKATYYPNYVHLIKPNQQLIDFLITLKNQHTTVLVTMAQKNNAMLVLESLKIKNLFDIIITGDEISNAKPHPESYQKALSLTGLSPSEAIAFEDSESGAKAATSAGIRVMMIRIPGGIS